jgi:predicted RNase H-like HicB family nuclease
MLVKLEAYNDGEFWCARGIDESVFAQGKTFEELLDNVREALALHFEEELGKGEELEISIRTETNIKSKIDSSKSQSAPATHPDKETQRRRALVDHMLQLREELPPLGMTTTDLVRLSREERSWFYDK